MKLIKTFQKITSQMDAISAYNTLMDQLGSNFKSIEKAFTTISSIRYGTTRLDSGLATVYDSKIKTSSLIFLGSLQTSVAGIMMVKSITNGEKFEIKSSDGSNGHLVCYLIIDPP